jgi:hypothetical protein
MTQVRAFVGLFDILGFSDLVRSFFEKAKGSTIRGYKTKNSLVVDV